VRVCSVRYLASNAHVQYCHLWPVRFYNIFLHNLTKDTIFGKSSCNDCCSGKAVNTSITYSECVSAALGISQAMRMRNIVICGLSGSTIFFCVISQKTRFSGKVTEHKICVWFSVQLSSEKFLGLRRTEPGIIKGVYRFSRKVHIIFVWL